MPLPADSTGSEEGRYKATLKRKFKLPWRKAGLLISMIQWTRTSRLSIKISLSLSTGSNAVAWQSAPDVNVSGEVEIEDPRDAMGVYQVHPTINGFIDSTCQRE